MNVDQVIKKKGHHVELIAPDQTISDAVKALAEQNIGALIVVNDQEELVGVVSERDVIRCLADRGTRMLKHEVQEIMSRGVVTCGLNDTVSHVMKIMTDRRMRHLPVLQDGRLMGMISIGDLVKHRVAEIEFETRFINDYVSGTSDSPMPHVG
jgi:CBS domain-containing protein